MTARLCAQVEQELLRTTYKFVRMCYEFLPRDAMHSADCAVARCLSVCPSVRYTPVFCWNGYIFTLFNRRVATPFYSFYRAMYMHKRGLCCHAVSVCPSVTFVDHVKTWLPQGRPQGKQQEAQLQLSLTNRAMLVCKVVEVWQDFLSESVDKKFTYICYRRLIRHEWIYYGSKNCVNYNSYKIV